MHILDGIYSGNTDPANQAVADVALAHDFGPTGASLQKVFGLEASGPSAMQP